MEENNMMKVSLKAEKKKNFKNETKGITLIALVITIVLNASAWS